MSTSLKVQKHSVASLRKPQPNHPWGFGPFLQKETDMKHQKYNHYPEVKNAKLNARAEAAVDFLAAIAVGIVLAVLLAWRG